MTKCYKHPGGSVELPADAFYASDRDRPSAMCRECRLRGEKERAAAKKNGTYVAKRPVWARHEKPATNDSAPHVATEAALITPAHFVKIGGYYFAQGTILLADTLQADKVTLHTTILEIDGETKHPRNKKLLFTRQHAPEEYYAVLAYLSAASGVPTADPSMNEEAAMALAEEATKALAAAQEQIKELRTKLDKFKAVLAD